METGGKSIYNLIARTVEDFRFGCLFRQSNNHGQIITFLYSTISLNKNVLNNMLNKNITSSKVKR